MPSSAFTHSVAAIITAFALARGGPIAAAAAPAPRPNIVVILTDDMGFSDIGCFGGEIQTPNLDKLAAGGLRFTQFYNTARCCPTRAALLSGLYSHQAGVGHMTDDKGVDAFSGELNRKCVTIAEALRPAGYSTYMAGKWHVSRNFKGDGPRHNWPIQRGFDRFYGMVTGGGNYFDPAALTRDNTPITPLNDTEYQPAAGQPYYFTDAIADHAVRYIREHHAKSPSAPLFMYVAFTAAHWPMHAKEADIAKYKGKYEGGYGPIRAARYERLKKMGIVQEQWAMTPQDGNWEKVADKAWESRCMEVYAAMVDCMDQGVGRIVEELRRSGRLDNTLILYLQDNGGCAEPIGRQARKEGEAPPQRAPKPTLEPLGKDELQTAVIPKRTREGYVVRQGEGVMPGAYDTYIAYGQGWANVSNTPFRLYKHWEHEGGIATPLIAHWPAGIARAGELDHQPGHLIDIMATCVELSGARYPGEHLGQKITPMEGKSLSPAFSGKTIERDAIYWEHEGNRAIRQGKWKLVAKGPGGPWELYDMLADRTELNDLSAQQPELVKELREKWEAWAKRAGVLPWVWKPAYGQKESATPPERPMKVTLKAGDALAGDVSPQVDHRAIIITAKIEQPGDGVIAAQGGTAHGYALYMKDGALHFATRVNNKLNVVFCKEKLLPGAATITATLAKDGTVTITADAKELVRQKLPGALSKTPVDGLSIGHDSNAPVAEYEAPFKFSGKLGEVVIEAK